MKVRDLARRAGVAASAVRSYKAAGALQQAQRRSNGFREFTEKDAGQLRLVITLRRLGLTPVAPLASTFAIATSRSEAPSTGASRLETDSNGHGALGRPSLVAPSVPGPDAHRYLESGPARPV